MTTPDPKVLSLRDVAAEAVELDGARHAVAQSLLTAGEGTGAFDIRVVRLKPGGVSADHAHPWEQANYVLGGSGTVALGDEVRPVGADDFVYVPPLLRHRFTNTGTEDLVLLSTLGPKD